MRIIRNSVAVSFLLLAGCIVTSVYPFYTPKDLGFEPALLGQWQDANQENDHWEFNKAGTNAYLINWTSGDQTNRIRGHLFKLGTQTFMDLFGAEGSCDAFPPPIASHMVLRVVQVGRQFVWPAWITIG